MVTILQYIQKLWCMVDGWCMRISQAEMSNGCTWTSYQHSIKESIYVDFADILKGGVSFFTQVFNVYSKTSGQGGSPYWMKKTDVWVGMVMESHQARVEVVRFAHQLLIMFFFHPLTCSQLDSWDLNNCHIRRTNEAQMDSIALKVHTLWEWKAWVRQSTRTEGAFWMRVETCLTLNPSDVS